MSTSPSLRADLSLALDTEGQSATCRMIARDRRILVVTSNPVLVLVQLASTAAHAAHHTLPESLRILVTDHRRRPLLRVRLHRGRWRIRPVGATGVVIVMRVALRLRHASRDS